MSVAGALAAGRRSAEALMVDAGSATRPTGDTAIDEETGADVPVYAALFSSSCKIQSRNLTARDAEAGGREATSVRVELHLPMSADALEVDDVWTMTASTHDPALVGRVFRVVAPVGKSFATARRYEVEEVVA